jgi:replicative DNA helicase
MQTWSAIAANQPLAQAVGAKTILRGMEEAARLGGAGKDFKLDASGEEQPNQEQMVQMAQQIQQSAVEESVKQVTQLVAEQVVKPAAEQIGKQQQQIDQMAQEVNAVAQGAAATQVAVEKLSQIVQNAMSAPPLPPQMPPQMPYGTEPIPPVGAEPIAGAGTIVPPQMALPV